MENKDQSNSTPPKRKGGRRPKAAQDKASFKVGSYWLTASEKAEYDRLYEASRLENQTEFFRRVMFGDGLKLYYVDVNTDRIYSELLRIENEIKQIGINYNQVTKRVNAVSSDQNIFSSIKELKALTELMQEKFIEIIRLYDSFSPFAEKK